MKKPTPSDIKHAVEQSPTDSHFFTRKTMSFFGDTMRNYGVRGPVQIVTASGDSVQCWELYRRKAVKHGVRGSAYFACDGLRRVSGEVKS